MEISRNIQGGQGNSYTNGICENKGNIDDSTGQNNSSISNPSDKPIEDKDLKKAIDRLNKFVEDDNISIEYDIHPQFKDVMVKIVDKRNGNILTEVPPKKILDMVAKMCELAGVIFDKKA